jgi:hypothetical protein
MSEGCAGGGDPIIPSNGPSLVQDHCGIATARRSRFWVPHTPSRNSAANAGWTARARADHQPFDARPIQSGGVGPPPPAGVANGALPIRGSEALGRSCSSGPIRPDAWTGGRPRDRHPGVTRFRHRRVDRKRPVYPALGAPGHPLSLTPHHIRAFLEGTRGRVLEPVGSLEDVRWRFAHFGILWTARESLGLNRYPDYNECGYAIQRWAQRWRDARWISPPYSGGVPRYLLDEYPATLTDDPDRLAELTGDPAWIAAAIPAVGVDHVLATLRTAAAARRGDAPVAAMLTVVTGQRLNLLPPHPIDRLDHVLRQLCCRIALRS